jgi:leucine dehydrogenase
MAIAVHHTIEGRALGGCRIWHYPNDDAVVREAERLARSMTFKAAAAGLPLGGAKAVISAPADGLRGALRQDALQDFAEFVDSFDGRYITAQDVGTSLQDMEVVERYTDHMVGRPASEGGCGDPSPYTARGVDVAVRASVDGPIAGKHAVVIGLGHVGGELARRLREDGVRLTVADVDASKRAFAERLGATWCSPEEALEIEADVLSPCALGGVFTAESVPRLRVPVIAGAANTQLAEDGVAELLRTRGILWAPDFVINAGGLIAVADEIHGFDRARAERSIDAIAGTLDEVYTRAAHADTNTLIAAKQLANERLGGIDGSHF